MPRFVEVTHALWIAAPPRVVSAQFADLDHHIRANVHPKLRFEVLERRAGGSARYLQEVKLLGIRQRDVFERRVGADGSIEDLSVEGFNRGGSVSFSFEPRAEAGRSGTWAQITVRLPLPPVIGALIRPLLAAQVRRELTAAALEDKDDIERGSYARVAGAALLAAG
jgi:hypothetical protein